MNPFTVHTGLVVPLARENVDTDQIIPKQFLKRVERTGFGEFLFFDWRADDPEFVLDRPAYTGASILAAGANFGSGSSREHAAWALLGAGFRAVIAPSFGDIFRTNAAKSGLLAVVLPGGDVAELLADAAARPGATATVDLERRVVVVPSGREVAFAFDDETRRRLLAGLDDIALTLSEHAGAIDAYEAARERSGPVTTALR